MPTQKDRLLAIDIEGQSDDTLLLRSFSINEQLGRLFQMEVEMDSEETDIKFEDIVAKKATVRLTMPNDDTRYFCGIVTRFVQEQQGTVARYRATLSPKLWLLTRTADCKIFQDQTVPDIIDAVFQAHGLTSGTDYKSSLTAMYIKQEFCVQYRETAFNFVSRLMEQEGIYYFFKHDEDGKHVLVLADANSAHDPFPGYDDLTYRPATGKHEEQRESVTDWIVEKEIQTGKYKLTDYNFQKPAMDLLAHDEGQRSTDLEIFDYPGGYAIPEDGQTYVKLRLQELQAQYEIAHANTTARGVSAGFKFTLKGHPRSGQERDYLVISMSLRATAGAYASGSAEGGEFFSCNFSAMPVIASPPLPYRTPRTTPKPMIRGPQTAIVTGAAGEEICTDKFGRVKLQFFWDRYGKKDDKSSCWVRVSQNWAGAAWGSLFLPRVGQEVIVEFLEGDPDRPIVTGRVYHGTNVVPYALPDEKTKSTVKSNSSPGGGGSNEIRFEDKKGSEEIFVHAQKDQNIKVENDETTNIGNDRTETVGKDETITINGSRTETVAKDESITINGGRTETVAKDEDITINGGRTENVAKDESITISGGRTEDVAKDENITIGGARTESVGKDESVSVSGGRTVNITKADSLTVGSDLTINATDSITITTGSASITMKSDGTIQINGKDVNIEGSGKIQASASSDLILKGSSIAAN
ncbi:MAG TPA: type VI secretion system tip protein TssI/VgrG [Verrucomicrobiae bacterium]|nr:type VI secretion system tip protein TssI/VgrG [Verrucomicrobiae bacterium]